MNVGFCKNDLYVGPWTGGPWGVPKLVYMQANFGGWGFFDFEDLAPFCLPSEMPLDHAWGQKIESAQKIYASRG